MFCGGMSINSSTVPLTIDGGARQATQSWGVLAAVTVPSEASRPTPGATVIVTASGACRRSASVKTRKKKEHWQRHRQLVCCRLQQPLPFLRALGKQAGKARLCLDVPSRSSAIAEHMWACIPGTVMLCQVSAPAAALLKSLMVKPLIVNKFDHRRQRSVSAPSGAQQWSAQRPDHLEVAAVAAAKETDAATRRGTAVSVRFPRERGGGSKEKESIRTKTMHKPSRHMICPARRR